MFNSGTQLHQRQFCVRILLLAESSLTANYETKTSRRGGRGVVLGQVNSSFITEIAIDFFKILHVHRRVKVKSVWFLASE